MKKVTFMAIAFTLFFGVQLLIPNESEAQIRCSTDFYGNDNTSFSDGSSMSCRTDFYGNYICN